MKAGSRVPTRRGLLSVVRLGLVVLMLASLPTPAFAAIGDLDTTFGVTSSGINYTEISGAGSKDWIHGLALQNDGMIVAVGEADTTFAVARYNTVGQLDTANFNPFNGFVTTAIGTASIANAVAVQNDGKIVVVGSSSDGVRDYFTVARYTTAGALDIATFNNPTGYVTSTLAAGSHVATAVVLQNDGKIVVAGYSTTQFVVARYTTTGALDTGAFNAPNGFRTINIGSAEQAEAVGLQADGKIILAGHADTGQSDDFAVARVTTAGALDTTFNGGLGFITTDFPTDQIDLGQALAIQPDEKIVVAGYTKSKVGGATEDFALARYNANGTLDTSFGTNGRTITAVTTNDDQAFGVALQPTGRVVLAGTSIDATTFENLTVARYTDAGVLDTTFAAVGYVTTNVGSHLAVSDDTADFLEAVVIQSDNKIVVGGYTDHPISPGDDNFVIARYESPNISPTVTSLVKTGSEDILMAFTQAEFVAQFSDTDGDSLAKVQVTTLPVSGTLKLSGVDVIASQVILASALGNLAYQPAANIFGTDTFVWNGTDGLAYADTGATVGITVTAVNDAPVNTVPGATNVNEDASLSGLVFSIADIDAGTAPDFQFTLAASHGGLTLTATTGLTLTAGSNGAHLMTFHGTRTDVNAALGSVAYGPDANYNGSDAIVLTANDGGNTGTGGPLQDIDVVTMTVNPVNDAPVLDPVGDQSGNEDTLVAFDANATDIDAGQTLAFSLAPGAPTGAAIDPGSGAFTWTPAEVHSPGVYTVTVQVADNGAPSLNDTQAVRITVNEVNDAPIFTGGPSQVVDEDAGVQTVTGWATNIIPGTADEATQALTFHVSASHAALFASQPAIVAATGALTYTPAANIHGAAAITVTLQDNGGAANGGVDTSAAYFFTITVNAVNDAPVVGDITRQGYAGSLVAFSLADFLAVFSDLEGDALARVRITTLPISGTLRLDGVPVTAGQELTATEAVIGGLTFTPAANAKGQASFGWNGSDGLAYAAADGLVTVSILGSRTRLPILIR